MTQKELELFINVITTLGQKNQHAVAIEELQELGKELTKVLRDKPSRMKIAEELADVLICIDQIKLMHGISDNEIKIFRDYKIKRLNYMYDKGVYK